MGHALVEQEGDVEAHDDEHRDVKEKDEDDEGKDSLVGEDGNAKSSDAYESDAHHLSEGDSQIDL